MPKKSSRALPEGLSADCERCGSLSCQQGLEQAQQACRQTLRPGKRLKVIFLFTDPLSSNKQSHAGVVVPQSMVQAKVARRCSGRKKVTRYQNYLVISSTVQCLDVAISGCEHRHLDVGRSAINTCCVGNTGRGRLRFWTTYR